MKCTRFMRKCQTSQGEMILLNTYNGNMTIVNQHNTEACVHVLNHPNESDFPEIRKYLTEREYLVNDSVNEALRAELSYLEAAHSTHTLLLTILVTEDCNFRCRYCYEEHNKGKMSHAVCDSIKKYLNKNLYKYDMLQVNWFGGEPLEALDVIADLSSYFLKICAEQKKPYRASMTTNGYSLDYDTFEKLYSWHVVDYQITLDGNEEAHNLTRPHKSGGSTYRCIVDNLKNIRDRVKTRNINITIRTNITKSVMKCVEEHINFLSQEFGHDPRFGVLFKIAWSNEKDTNFNREELLETGQLHSVLDMCLTKNLRFKINREQICSIAGICYAAHSNAFVIGSDGTIYKCTVEYKKDINQVGKLGNDGEIKFDKDKLAFWITRPTFNGEYEKCSHCFFQPACMGVYCPINRFDETGQHRCVGMKDYVDEYMQLCAKSNEMCERM